MLNIDDRLIKEVLPKIGPNAFSVLMAIASHMDTKTGTSFPGNKRLTELTGIGRDGLYAALEKLKEHNLLSVKQEKARAGKFGKRTIRITTKYIGIFILASAAPFTDQPDTVEPLTGEPYTADPAHNRLANNEQINKKEEINKKEQNSAPSSLLTEPVNFSPASAQSGNSTVEEKEKTPLTPSSAAPRSPKKEKAFEDKDVAKHLSGKEQVFFAEILKNETWPKWLDYKKKKFKFEYDAADSAARIIRKLYTFSGGNAEIAAEIAAESRANGWKGFFPLEKPNAPAPFPKPYAQPMSEMAGLVIRK